jgi:hypothetical protein
LTNRNQRQLKLQGLHNDRTEPREDRLWRLAFQTDRFMSLMLNKSYAVDYKEHPGATSGETFAYHAPPIHDDMMRLAQLTGKVLDMTNNVITPDYSEILAIDLELIHFGSLMPMEPCERDIKLSDLKGKQKTKAIGEIMKNFVFLQAKLVLHLPWMLRCSSNPQFIHSRSSCLEAARHLLSLFRVFQTTGLPGLSVGQKCSPTALVGYAAAAAIILGQIGTISNTEDPQQLQKDDAQVRFVMEAIRDVPAWDTEMSASILEQLIQLRDRQFGASSMLPTLTIPFLGKITIHSLLPQSKQLQDAPQVFNNITDMAMLATCPPAVPGSLIHYASDHLTFDSYAGSYQQDTNYGQPLGINIPELENYSLSSNNHLPTLNTNLSYVNNDLNFLELELQAANNSPYTAEYNHQSTNYSSHNAKYGLQVLDWSF